MPKAQAQAASRPAEMQLLGEEFFEEAGLGEFLGKTLRCIRWWRETKQGPPWIAIGRRVVYRKASVLQWMVKAEVEPHPSRRSRKRSAVTK
jgi:hypothetical protein